MHYRRIRNHDEVDEVVVIISEEDGRTISYKNLESGIISHMPRYLFNKYFEEIIGSENDSNDSGSTDDIDVLKNRLKYAIDEIKSLEVACEELREKNWSLETQFHEIEKEVSDKRKIIEKYEEERSKLQAELASANDKTIKLDGEKRELEIRLKKLQSENPQPKVAGEKSHLGDQIEKLNKEITLLEKEKSNLKNQIFQLNNKINQFQHDIEKLKEKLKNSEKEINDGKKEIERLNTENRNLLAKLTNANDRILELEDEKKVVVDDLASYKKKAAQLEEEKSTLENQIARLKEKSTLLENEKRQIEAQYQKAQTENSRLKAKVEELKKEIDGLIEQIYQLNIKISQLKRENHRLIEENDALRESVGRLKDENKRLKGKQILPIALSILLGAVAIAVVLRVLLKTSNPDSELQRKLNEKEVECSRLASLNDTLCEENRALLATKDCLLRENDSLIEYSARLTSSLNVRFKLDSQTKWIGLWMFADRKERPERKFWIDVKRAICLRSLELKCDQTGSAVIQVYRYKEGQSTLVSEQEVCLKKGIENRVELIDFYFDITGLYYLMICNNNCGSFTLQKVVDDWEFRQCYSDDIDILGLGDTPPNKKEKFTSVYDYGYFVSLMYCKIIE